MNEKQKAALDPANLAHFSGSLQFYRHWLPRILMTEGVHYVTENGAAWLVDVVASVQHGPEVRGESFQVWKLRVKDGKGKVTCTDGNGKMLYVQHIPGTDYPHEELTLWAAANEQGGITVMLPGEY